jgi:hypothetical protein
MRSSPSTLVFIVGPGAVGKMTVGAALAARTGLKLFHNHQTIDLVLPYFAFGSPPSVCWASVGGGSVKRSLPCRYRRSRPGVVSGTRVDDRLDSLPAFRVVHR